MLPNYGLTIRKWTWRLLGLLMLLLIPLIGWFGYRFILGNHHIPERIIQFIDFLLCGILFFFSCCCFRRAKKITATPAQSVLARDRRRPILYLRSFSEDRRLAWSGLEEALSEVMKEIGPFIALGASGESLPQLGAARMYTRESDWQEQIRDLMSRAQLMIFWVGDSPGFWWEVQQAVKLMAPERLLFLVSAKPKLYERFREQAEKYLPCRLPDVGRVVSSGPSLPAIIVCFDSNWIPKLLHRSLSFVGWNYLPFIGWFRSSNTKKNARLLKQTLAQVWRRLDQLQNIIIPNSCPQCGSSFQRAYIEDGGQGDWCPVCKVSLQKMRGEI